MTNGRKRAIATLKQAITDLSKNKDNESLGKFLGVILGYIEAEEENELTGLLKIHCPALRSEADTDEEINAVKHSLSALIGGLATLNCKNINWVCRSSDTLNLAAKAIMNGKNEEVYMSLLKIYPQGVIEQEQAAAGALWLANASHNGIIFTDQPAH